MHLKALHQQQQQEKEAFSLKVTLSQAETISGDNAERRIFFVSVIVAVSIFSRRMLRGVCEQNGHLGFTVREALHAYLEGLRWVWRLKRSRLQTASSSTDQRAAVCFSHSVLQSRQEALAKYILAAETGLGMAQVNAAHLCEVNLWVGGSCSGCS